MMSCTRLYVYPTEALVDQARKNSRLSLMKILVWRGGKAGKTKYNVNMDEHIGSRDQI